MSVRASKLSHRDASPGIGACNPTGEAGATSLPNYTLESAQEAIVSMLHRIKHANVGRVDTFRLKGLAGRLRRYLAAADREAGSVIGDKFRFGCNDLGPALADTLLDCEGILGVRSLERRGECRSQASVTALSSSGSRPSSGSRRFALQSHFAGD